ncbi:MAG: hypothetical protein HYT89_04780 [Candidatus Omnitrophica bacterium]|nr:hypothetical protein [Candidatus Omnitrophota bacterium]
MALVALTHSRKFNKALQLLQRTAAEKKNEIAHDINRVTRMVSEAVEEKGGKARKAIADLNKRAHKNPWKFIGGTAAGSALVGYLTGLCKRK